MDNNKTLQPYEDHVQDYIDANKPSTEGGLKDWVDRVLGFIPKQGLILELGSAYGRDADYMESAGYKVVRTDAVNNFVNLMKAQGHQATILNVLTDDFGTGYDAIYANAVFLHFKPKDVTGILKKSYDCLKPGGILAFSVKKGDGEAWSDRHLGAPRYFHFWQGPDLQKAVEAAGFTMLELSERVSSRQTEWLQVIAKK